MLIQISIVYTLRVCSQVERTMQRIEAAWGRLLRGNSCYTVTKKIRRTTKKKNDNKMSKKIANGVATVGMIEFN